MASLEKNNLIPPTKKNVHELRFVTTRRGDNGALRESLLNELKTIFKIDTFIETGTYLGDTTVRAASIFNQVHTVELSKELFHKASTRFKNYKNITAHCGESNLVLRNILSKSLGRCLFYLDGHYSGHVTARGVLDTPVIEELEAIGNAQKTDSILLIDDIRLFQNSSYPKELQSLDLGLETYPDLSVLLNAILKVNPHYQFCFLGDALLAFPKSDLVSLSPVLRACTVHRLEAVCEDLSKEDLQEADDVIIHAQEDEEKEIDVYYHMYAPFELQYGYRSYACLWKALTLKGQGKEDAAHALLNDAKSHSLPNWRAYFID